MENHVLETLEKGMKEAKKNYSNAVYDIQQNEEEIVHLRNKSDYWSTQIKEYEVALDKLKGTAVHNDRELNKHPLNLSTVGIKEQLELAAWKNKFITTTTKQRVLGKSRALIEFAKENDYSVIVRDHVAEKHHVHNYEYGQIVSAKKLLDYVHEENKSFVVEEGVGEEIIKELIKRGYKIITGFIVER